MKRNADGDAEAEVEEEKERKREEKTYSEPKRYLNVISITEYFYHYPLLYKNDMPGDVCNS